MLRTSIRGLAAGLLVVSLGACTAVFSDVASTWKYATEKREDASLNPEQISEFPYTAIYVQRGSAPRSLVVLGFVDDTDGEALSSPAYFNWISADRETLVTQQGRLVRTADLEPELLGRTQLVTDPLRCFIRALNTSGFSGLAEQTCASSWDYVIDVKSTMSAKSEATRFSVETRSEFSVGPPEILSLPAADVEVVKITEQVHFSRSRAGAKQTVSNEFWIEQDGHVVKSIQYITPHQSPFAVTQVKWVGRDYE